MYLTPNFDFPVTDKLKHITLRMLDKNPLKRATIEEIENIISGGWKIEKEAITDSKNNNLIPEDIFHIYQKMAKDDKHIVYAQYRLAFLLEKGDKTAQNIEQALYWYKKAAISGYAVAQHRLGYLFLYGKHDIKKSYKVALYWFTKAVNQRYKRSQYYLGKMYEYGKGVSRNKNKAIELYTLATQNSDLKAEKRLNALMEEYK
jgi:TPR repeat protein